MRTQSRTMFLAAAAACICAAPAFAQFGDPGSSTVKERVTGEVLTGEGGVTPEGGDQIGAFVGTRLVGKFVFTGSTVSRAFDITVNGDDPDTTPVEGARQGEKVTFQYYDSSTNVTRTDVTPVNDEGETVNYTYAGAKIPPMPIPLPGFDLTPTRALDLRVGGGTGGGGDDDPTDKYDVDADGKVTTKDAAMVLRAMTGSSTVSGETAERADVNGDGSITTADAVEVLKNR